MAASKRLYEEVHYLEVQNDYYLDMYSVFKNPKVRHIRAVVKDDSFKDDTLHQAHLRTYLKAKKELETYEFNKRNNI